VHRVLLCQDVCHVLRDTSRRSPRRPALLRLRAALEMHPLDVEDRALQLRSCTGSGMQHHQMLYPVCPEEIHITDNAIIP